MPEETSSNADRGFGYGLGLLRPQARLFTVVVLASLFVFANTLPLSSAALCFGILLVILNGRFKLFGLFLLAIIVDSASRLIGNLIFSPSNDLHVSDFLIRINEQGLHNGLVGAMKRSAMICVGYATLMSSRFFDFYQGITYYFRHRTCRKWTMWFLRVLQLKISVVRDLYRGVLVRGLRPSLLRPRISIRAMKLVLEGIVVRLLSSIGKLAYAGESKDISMLHAATGALTAIIVAAGYEEQNVLKNAHITIDPGEFVLLLGLNKSGKTTLLRLLSGYIPHVIGTFQGHIKIGKADLKDMELDEISKIIRFLPDNPADAIAGLTVGQEVELTAKSPEDGTSALRAMGIESIRNQETHKLSGGEKCRCALAGILASDVQIVLLDNPLEPLDEQGRQEFIRTLLDFWKHSGATIIVADHLYYEFIPYVSRCILLDQGRVLKNHSGPIEIDSILRVTPPGSLVGLKLEVPHAKSEEVIAQLQNVTYVNDGAQILKGCSFKVRRGEIVALTGANGSGKTTAINILAGFLKPSSGTVRLNVGARRLNYVFQDFQAHLTKATVAEQLQLQPKLDGWDTEQAQRHYERVLHWTGLRPDGETAELHTSDARMLALSEIGDAANFLILDEPSVGLDVSELEKIVLLLRDLISAGKSALVVTHDKRLLRYATRVIRMAHGQVVAESDGAVSILQQMNISGKIGDYKLTVFEYGFERKKAFVMRSRNKTSTNQLLRIQFGCIFGATLGSIDCDCGLQVELGMRMIKDSGGGTLIYLADEEGRGHGMSEKLRMLSIERTNALSPLNATVAAGMTYSNYGAIGYIPAMLDELGETGPFSILSNNPQKIAMLAAVGVQVNEIVPINAPEDQLSEFGRRELAEKRVWLGHIDGSCSHVNTPSV
jgi:energy-coupling factor transport system ATP-binding protein